KCELEFRVQAAARSLKASLVDCPLPQTGVRCGRGGTMIHLTQEQSQALGDSEQPARAIDPRTGEEYLLIRRDVYEKVRSVLRPFGRGWDNPADDDLIRKDK